MELQKKYETIRSILMLNKVGKLVRFIAKEDRLKSCGETTYLCTRTKIEIKNKFQRSFLSNFIPSAACFSCLISSIFISMARLVSFISSI